MRKRGLRLGAILLIIVVVLVMLGGITYLARSIFSSNNTANNSVNNNNGAAIGQKILTNPSKDAKITMSIRGPVVAKEKHYDVDLTISQSSRNLVIYKDYDRKDVTKRIDLDNSDKAFGDLALALNNNGFMTESKAEVEKNAGLCSSGQLITFRVSDGNKTQELWTTSCSANLGNFGGKGSIVIDLLLKQIPGASQAIADAKDNY